MNIEEILQAVAQDPQNEVYTAKGIKPLTMLSPQAKIMIVGQAPGIKAQERQTVWDDRSGDRLRQWLGVNREIFYESGLFATMPMDFYFPGAGKSGDLPPRKGFAEKWHPLLLAEMPNVELFLLIGKYAQGYYLGDKMARNLTETVRNYEAYLPEYLTLVHPSPLNLRWLKKNPWFETEIIPYLQQRVQAILKEKK